MKSSKSIESRLKRIEKEMVPVKGELMKFPCPDGSFIEIPRGLKLVDLMALLAMEENEQSVDENERK